MGLGGGSGLSGMRASSSVGASEAAGPRVGGGGARIVAASESLVLLPTSSRVGGSGESDREGADSSFVFPGGDMVVLSESDVFGTLGSLIPC